MERILYLRIERKHLACFCVYLAMKQYIFMSSQDKIYL